MVTIEDLVEEIVGEIEDEQDADDVNENQLKRINDNTIIVDASYKILELENLFSNHIVQISWTKPIVQIDQG